MPEDRDGGAAGDASSEDDSGRRVLTRDGLSDISINAVPIVIIAAFVLKFGLLGPGGDDPLILFHVALVVGVVVVSCVSARIIRGEREPLQGSAAGSVGPDATETAAPAESSTDSNSGQTAESERGSGPESAE
jgi:hypothetical protein